METEDRREGNRDLGSVGIGVSLFSDSVVVLIAGETGGVASPSTCIWWESLF